MDMILEEADDITNLLRKQYKSSAAVKRVFSGFGFFLYFHPAATTARLSGLSSFRFGDVVAEIDGLKNGAGFLLRVERGAVACLEGFSYEESWPSKYTNFTVFRNKMLPTAKMVFLDQK